MKPEKEGRMVVWGGEKKTKRGETNRKLFSLSRTEAQALNYCGINEGSTQ